MSYKRRLNQGRKKSNSRRNKQLRGGNLTDVSEIMKKHNLVKQDYELLSKYMTFGELAPFSQYSHTVSQTGKLSSNTVIVAKTTNDNNMIIVGKNIDPSILDGLEKSVGKEKIIQYSDDISYHSLMIVEVDPEEDPTYNPNNYDEYLKKRALTDLSFKDTKNIFKIEHDFEKKEIKFTFSETGKPETEIKFSESEIYMPNGKIENNVVRSKKSKIELDNLKERREMIPEDALTSMSGGRKRRNNKHKIRRRKYTQKHKIRRRKYTRKH
jgi:hypothetical protein